MGVHNPTESAKIAYTTSKAGTRNIVDAIKGKLEFSLPDHNVLMSKEMANMHTTLSSKMKSHFTQYWEQWSQYKSIAACKVSSAGLQEERNNLLEERIETMLEEAVTLGDKERQGAKELLRDFKDIIALPDDDLGHTRLLYHHIRTEDTQPICQCARRLPFHQHSQVRKLLNDMLDNDIIELSTGPWASPIVLVRKKDGGVKLCIDFRKYPERPLPRIDETLDTLDGACYISTLDLASGYWQVELHPKDKEKTAFVTPFGFYQGLSRKFHKPWQGPYRVVKIIGPTEYRIVDCIRKKKIVHFNHLKRARIGKVPELAKGEDMVEGARIDTLPVGPVPGNRNGNDLVEDSLEEETVGMQVTDQAPKGPIAQVPGPPEEIPPAPVAQVPGQPAPAAVRQSTRQTRPPVRYGDPISLPDDVVTCGNTLFNVTWCQTSRHVYASVV
ncbi:hypothetical protein EMCRGX_G015392 [Ephydatia muelleri]